MSSKIKATLYSNNKLEIDSRSLSVGGSWQSEINTGLASPYDKESVTFVANRLEATNSKILFDVGANTGSFSLISKFLDCHSYAFEPQSDIYQILKSNVEINKLQSNTTLIKVALSDDTMETSLNLQVPFGNRGLASVGNLAENDFSHFEEVDVNSIDNIAKQYSIKKVDFIKIDVEGFELKVLNGAKNVLKSHQPELLIEYSKTYQCGYSPKKLIEFLKNKGYTLKVLNSEDLFCYPTNSTNFCPSLLTQFLDRLALIRLELYHGSLMNLLRKYRRKSHD